MHSNTGSSSFFVRVDSQRVPERPDAKSGQILIRNGLLEAILEASRQQARQQARLSRLVEFFRRNAPEDMVVEFSRAHVPVRRVFSFSRAGSSSFLVLASSRDCEPSSIEKPELNPFHKLRLQCAAQVCCVIDILFRNPHCWHASPEEAHG